MTPHSPLIAEYRVLERVAAEYEAQGYTVEVQPSPRNLPEPLRGLEIDLLMRRDDETVILEVGVPDQRHRSQDWERLQTGARALGWQVVLRNMTRADIAVPLDEMEIAERLADAERLLAAQASESALLVAWAATEAVLERLAELVELEPTVHESRGVVRGLHSLGALSEGEFTLLERLADLQSVTAHGRRPLKPATSAEIGLLIELTRWYLNNPTLVAYEIADRLAQDGAAAEAAEIERRYPGVPALIRDEALALLRPSGTGEPHAI